MKKYQKYLLIAGVIVDVAITIFLFVISIIMLVNIGKYGDAEEAMFHIKTGLIHYLLGHTNVYFWGFVFPLFVLLAANIIGLVFYVKKTSVKEPATQLSDLSEEEKEALKKELLKDLEK